MYSYSYNSNNNGPIIFYSEENKEEEGAINNAIWLLSFSVCCGFFLGYHFFIMVNQQQ